MSAGTLSILGCIRDTCAAAAAAVAQLLRVEHAAAGLESDLAASGAALRGVVNGGEDQVVSLPLGGRLPTLAGALANLDATPALGAVAVESHTAVAGQTEVTLSATPASGHHLEVSLNGAVSQWISDYTVAGAVVTFASELDAGDLVTARVFTIS